MIKEFIIEHFFLIAKTIIYAGIALCVYAGLAKKGNNKKTSNDLMKDNTDIREYNNTNNTERISKNNGILMGVGVTAVVVGIILLVLGVAAIILFIYVFIHLGSLFDALE